MANNENAGKRKGADKSRVVSDRELREQSNERFRQERQERINKRQSVENERSENLRKSNEERELAKERITTKAKIRSQSDSQRVIWDSANGGGTRTEILRRKLETYRRLANTQSSDDWNGRKERLNEYDNNRYDWRSEAISDRGRNKPSTAPVSQEFQTEQQRADYAAREEESAREAAAEQDRKRAEREKLRSDRKNAMMFGKSVKLFADTVKHASKGDALGAMSNVGKGLMMTGNPIAMAVGASVQAATKIAEVYEGFRRENVRAGQLTGEGVGAVADKASFGGGMYASFAKSELISKKLGLDKSQMQERYISQSLNQGTLATESQLIRQRAMENTLGLDTRGMSTYMRAMKGGDFEQSSLRLIDKLSATENGNISKNNMVLASEKANQLMQMQQYYAYKQNYSKTSDVENMLLATNALGGAGSDFRAANTATMLQEDMRFGGSQNKQMFQMGVAKRVAMQEGVTGQANILSRAYDITKAGTDPKYLAGITSELDKMSQGNAWTKKLTYSQFFGNQSQDVVNSLIEKGGGFREALLKGDKSAGTGINKDYVIDNSSNAVSLIDSIGNTLSNSVKTFSDAIMIFTNGVDKFSETATKEPRTPGEK